MRRICQAGHDKGADELEAHGALVEFLAARVSGCRLVLLPFVRPERLTGLKLLNRFFPMRPRQRLDFGYFSRANRNMKNFGIEAVLSKTAAPRLTQLLPPEELALISSRATRRKYRDGEIIHERGDEQPVMGVVISGKIKLVYPRDDGQDIFSGVIHTGQNYGDAALLHRQSRSHRAVAIGDTVVDQIGSDVFSQLLERPAIVKALYVVASFRLSVALDLLDDMRVLNPDMRLAKLIVRMHNASGGSERLEFVQDDFASMLGVSTVTFAKSLRQLRHQGLVETGYGHLVIKDPGRLAAWVREKDPD